MKFDPAKMKHARIAAGLTQAELAARSKLAPETIRLLENGATDEPRMRTLLALAAALDVPPTAMYVEDEVTV